MVSATSLMTHIVTNIMINIITHMMTMTHIMTDTAHIMTQQHVNSVENIILLLTHEKLIIKHMLNLLPKHV